MTIWPLPYVVEGEWIDPNPDPIIGPRSHPFSCMEAYSFVCGNRKLIFPSREAWLAWVDDAIDLAPSRSIREIFEKMKLPTRPLRVSHSPAWHCGWVRMSSVFFKPQARAPMWLAPGHRIRATRQDDEALSGRLLIDVAITGPLMPEVYIGEEAHEVECTFTMHGPELGIRDDFELEGQYRWTRDEEEHRRSWCVGHWPSIEAYRQALE